MIHKNNDFKDSKGFTLIELMVSVTISVLIMMVVLFSYRTFSDNLALSAAEQEISISIRQVQVYGLSVRQSSAGSGNFTTGFGIYASANDPTNYYLFSDANNDNKCDDGKSCFSAAELMEKDALQNGVKIAPNGICGEAFGGGVVCPPSGGAVSIEVTFVRPNPNAVIRFTDKNGAFLGGAYQSGQIQLISPLGKTATVTIGNTGQISVK